MVKSAFIEADLQVKNSFQSGYLEYIRMRKQIIICEVERQKVGHKIF